MSGPMGRRTRGVLVYLTEGEAAAYQTARLLAGTAGRPISGAAYLTSAVKATLAAHADDGRGRAALVLLEAEAHLHGVPDPERKPTSARLHLRPLVADLLDEAREADDAATAEALEEAAEALEEATTAAPHSTGAPAHTVIGGGEDARQ